MILNSSPIRNIIYLFFVGFSSLLGQVILLREVNVAFYGIELIYILGLGIWLFGTAIGVWFAKFNYKSMVGGIDIFFVALGIILILEIIFLRGLRIIFGATTGGYLNFSYQLMGLLISLIPVSAISGILFNWCAREYLQAGKSLGLAYSIESSGAVIGAICSTLFLSIGIQNFTAALICSSVIGFMVLYYKAQKNFVWKIIFIPTTLIIVLLFRNSSQFDNWLTIWNHHSLVATVDTPYSRISITKNEDQLAVFSDDALAYETEGVAAEEFVQMSTLQTEKIHKALVLGGGFSGIVDQLIKLNIEKIINVEIDERMIRIVKSSLPEKLKLSLEHPDVTIIYDDPRKYLERGELYDLILISMPEPMSVQSNRYYTGEFFSLCKNSLMENGILSFRIKSAENLWTKQLNMRNGSIFKALRKSFTNVIVLPGTSNIYIATKSNVSPDYEKMIERFKKRKVETKLVSPQYIKYIFTNERYEQVKNELNRSITEPNSDLHPSTYGLTISLWLTKFGLSFNQVSEHSFSLQNIFTNLWLYVLLAVFVILFFTTKNDIKKRNIALLLLAGYIGMVMEIVLLFYYQTYHGVLFRDIGILLMLFMIGLSVGPPVVSKFSSRPFGKFSLSKSMILLSLFMIIVLCVSIYLIASKVGMHPMVISLILILSGFYVSAVFTLVSTEKYDELKNKLVHLYVADLIGGGMGSLLATLILIPFMGLIQTIALVIVLLLLIIILMLRIF